MSKMLQNLITPTNESDQILLLTNQTWADYEALASSNSHLQVSYLNNVITIVSPSRNHEKIAQVINLLIITYCRKFLIPYFNLGSADIKQATIAGKQPDCSYCFTTEKDKPDLAVEVNFTSGSINDLAKYQLLEVPEVWIWQNQTLTFYYLENGTYNPQVKSKYLKTLSSDLLTKFIVQGLTKNHLVIETEFFKLI